MTYSGPKEKGGTAEPTCPECGKKFSKAYNLKQHFEGLHPGSETAQLDNMMS